jgi:hypothetical protein
MPCSPCSARATVRPHDALPPAPRRAAPHCVPTSTTSQQPRHLVPLVVNDAVTSAPLPLPQHRRHARLAPHLARVHATITCKPTHARCCRAVASSPALVAWAPHVALPRRPLHANHAPRESASPSPQRRRRNRTAASSPAPRHAAAVPLSPDAATGQDRWPPLPCSALFWVEGERKGGFAQNPLLYFFLPAAPPLLSLSTIAP